MPKTLLAFWIRFAFDHRPLVGALELTPRRLRAARKDGLVELPVDLVILPPPVNLAGYGNAELIQA